MLEYACFEATSEVVLLRMRAKSKAALRLMIRFDKCYSSAMPYEFFASRSYVLSSKGLALLIICDYAD